VKAIVKTSAEPGALEWRDWPDPEPKAGDVLVEIDRAGICSTDLAIYDWTYRGRQPVSIPSMLGHEAAGVVSELGAGADGVEVGDRVALQVIWGRPHAPESILGHENLDPDWRHIGASALGGAFAERIAVPADRVLVLPDGTEWDDGALLEPLAVAAHAVELLGAQPGETFVVVGPGPFGLLMAAIARARGAARVAVAGLAGTDDARLKVAARGGTETVSIPPEPAAAATRILEAVGPADAVADCGGTGESTWSALEVAGQGARVALFGFTREARIEPLRQVIRKGLRLFGVSAAQRRHYGIALRLIETGAVRPSSIVTHRLPVERAADGLELVKSREAAKVILEVR
jgi:2-desacetyl-2-hydroxyethyl bacteriochlorophyllide A dehydrogenase